MTLLTWVGRCQVNFNINIHVDESIEIQSDLEIMNINAKHSKCKLLILKIIQTCVLVLLEQLIILPG